jgi:hypothetical protein
MPQTSVTEYQGQVVPGTLGPNQENSVIVTCIAAEAIPFGVVAEFNAAGQLINPKTTALGTYGVAGVVLRQALRMGGAYAPGQTSSYLAGEEVPVLRRGQVYAAFDGAGTVVPYATTANVDHSTTVATNRGMLTASATSTVAGSEVAALPAGTCTFYSTPGSNGACLVALFLP